MTKLNPKKWLAACGLATLAMLSQAKNVAQLQPIDEALSLNSTRQILGDMLFRFGANQAATPDPEEVILGELVVEGRTDTFSSSGNASMRGSKSDEVACRDALRAAISELVLSAKRLGANALVRVQSSYRGTVLDHPSAYECHIGLSRTVVGLKASAVKLSPRGNAALQLMVPLVHRYQVPDDTGFAPPTEAKALPIRMGGQADYQKYLGLPAPKAFAIAEDGGWRYQSANGEAMATVLNYCARMGKTCWLYAVDDHVVWQADPAKRISAVGQLMPAMDTASH